MTLYARCNEDKTQFQTLAEHIQNVAAGTKSTSTKIGLTSLGELAGLLHDIGKSTVNWQKYLLAEKPVNIVPHSAPGVFYMNKLFQDQSGENAVLLRQMLALLIRNHHGGQRDVITPDGEDQAPDLSGFQQEEPALSEYFSQICSYEKLHDLFSKAEHELGTFAQKLLHLACEQHKEQEQKVNTYQFFYGMTERFLYSALIDADRYDAARWENGESMKDFTLKTPDWAKMRDHLGTAVESLPVRNDIDRLRHEISRQCADFQTAEHGIYRLVVPTGGGKTLSSARLALAAAQRYQKEHIYFIEPYLTILEQNADVIREKLGDKNAVLEHHSNVVFADDHKGQEEYREYQKQTERWTSPIIFTSLVQLLEALYSEGTGAARRMNLLINSVILIDEVQSVPVTSLYLFNLGITFLSEVCHCIVILCTATPPSLSNVAYPLKQQDILSNTKKTEQAFQRTTINVDWAKSDHSIEEIADLVFTRFSENGSCMAVLNTKSTAKKLYDAVKLRISDNDRLYYLSTNLCPAHREKQIENMRKELADKQPVLCITTQLIEAGVDISFGCVVRDLAGLSSVIQAAGRCNRHDNKEIKPVYVVRCAGEEKTLTLLPDIEKGRQAMERLIGEMPQKDLLSQKAIETYYRYYFYEQKGAMGYPFSYHNRNLQLIDVLGTNLGGRMEYNKVNKSRLSYSMLAQSFQTAGEKYHPIGQKTGGVIVRYGWEGQEAVDKLLAATTSKEIRLRLRAIQRYTVNLYQNGLKKLIELGAVEWNERLGVYLLNENRYSEEFGVIFDENDNINDYIIG